MMSKLRGFTLIELLVVVAIIALLVAILIPTLQSARALAEEAACASNIKQIGYALRMYADNNEGKAPSAETHWWWFKTLMPYLMNKFEPEWAGNSEIYYEQVLGYGWFSCPKAADPADYTDPVGRTNYDPMPSKRQHQPKHPPYNHRLQPHTFLHLFWNVRGFLR